MAAILGKQMMLPFFFLTRQGEDCTVYGLASQPYARHEIIGGREVKVRMLLCPDHPDEERQLVE